MLSPYAARLAIVVYIALAADFALAAPSFANNPVLYSQPAYQSPVRAEPDDLLLLAGYGLAQDDVVVYEALERTDTTLAAPKSTPAEATSESGIAPVVSTADVPNALTVRLPLAMRGDRSYSLWVRSKDGAWSNGVKINDARPLWISPGSVYESMAKASLPRYLKVIGRNLQPAAGQSTRVRLTGPETITLGAPNGQTDSAINRYAAVVDLPGKLRVGKYAVAVSRDGVSWVELEGQTLSVEPDVSKQPEFRVSAYGCAPDDSRDHTACVVAAIHDANRAGGGDVVFAPGVWQLLDSASPGVTADGILVPAGVNLRGAGDTQTTLVRGPNWTRLYPGKPGTPPATFTLLGRNKVEGLRFTDAHAYTPRDQPTSILQLGLMEYRVEPRNARVVTDVTISHNTFDKPYYAISSGGLPIERLFVTYNEFGAYRTGLVPSGNRYDTQDKFRLDDSIIAFNTFKPGGYIDVAAHQGTMASELGAGQRLDFSNNVADGTSLEYLADASRDARGWRAAFFWHMNGSIEMMLMSQNVMTCTGDKTGDGEAIGYDNNANTFGFEGAQVVSMATPTSVSVSSPLRAMQDGARVGPEYYVGHWMQIARGKGLGQARKITGYTTNAANGITVFTVAPAWDVVPAPNESGVVIAREFWQVLTVANSIDQRTMVADKPLCQKSNRKAAANDTTNAGTISVWAQTADSVVEGNRQFDTSGIWLHQVYKSYKAANCTATGCGESSFLDFVEVRGNTIDGEYDWDSDCSWSGIYVPHAAAPPGSIAPAVASYGLSIAHNVITRADGANGGGISMTLSSYPGLPPNDWPLVDATLVYHNTISGMTGSAPRSTCGLGVRGRSAINLDHARLVWHSVLYANECRDASTAVRDGGTGTTQSCETQSSRTCGCP